MRYLTGDRGTKELARQLKEMSEVPSVRADIERVATTLGCFELLESGEIIRREPAKEK